MNDPTLQSRLDDALAEIQRLRYDLQLERALREDLAKSLDKAHQQLRTNGNDWPAYRAEGSTEHAKP